MALTSLAATQADPTRWDLFFTRFQAVGPTVAALIVLGGAVLTIAQKNRTDRRSLWWARVQWAADKAVDDDPGKRVIGAAALAALATRRVKDRADRELLGAIADDELADVARQVPLVDEGETVEFELDEGGEDGQS